MKLLEKIFNNDCPEYRAFRDHRAKIQACQDRLAELTRYIGELHQAKEEKRQAYFADNTVSNFKKLVAATRDHATAEQVGRDVYEAAGHFREQHMKDPEATPILVAALRVTRDRLAAEIARLNETERQHLEAAGLDPADREHPAIGELREYLRKIADALVAIPDWGPGQTQSPWQRWAPLLQIGDKGGTVEPIQREAA